MKTRKPRGYWTYDKCKEEALKCKTKNKLKNKYPGAHNMIYKNKWYELFKHMIIKEKPKKYWNYQKCKETVMKYEYYSEFAKNENSAISSIRKHKWNKLLDHLKRKKVKNGYWTYDKCKEIVLLCKSRSELHQKYSSVYSSIIENNFIDLFKYLKPVNCWTYKNCKKEALKYEYKKDMYKKSSYLYDKIIKNGWDEEMFKHMKNIGNLKKRLIYVYEFDDMFCYVGLTCNVEKRNNQHMNDIHSAVYKYKLINNNYKLIKKSEYINVEDAKILEGKILNHYKKNKWNILNRYKTGGIGGSKLIYNFNVCLNEAKKYNNKKDFRLKSNKFYNNSVKNNFINKIYKLLGWNKRLINYWNFEKCKTEALKFNRSSDFFKNSKSCYTFAHKRGWMPGITNHMIKRKNNGYWVYENCKKEMKKYSKKTDFSKKSKGAYSACRRNNWLNVLYKELNI